MNRLTCVLGCILVSMLCAGVASADTPDASLRVFLVSAQPTSDVTLDVFGMPAVVEADSAVGFGAVYEIRFSDRLGFETGISFVQFDFEVDVMGVGGEFGDAVAIPLLFGLDVHLLDPSSRADLYVGPVAAYTLWSNFDADDGSQSDLDDEFGIGAVLGVDVPLGSGGCQFNAAARYLQLSAEDPSLEIEIDPLFVELGFGYRF